MTNIELDRQSEWAKSLKLLQGLFPKWHVTNEQLETWRLEFGMMNPVWFRESLQLVYTKYSSDHPKPKWVHQAFREVKAGRTGIPIDSGYMQEDKKLQLDLEEEQHTKQVLSDRSRAKNDVANWSESDRIKYATLFSKHFKFMNNERCSPTDYGSWSDTFTQFVYVYRNMKNENNG